jgi:hypothetical protein
MFNTTPSFVMDCPLTECPCPLAAIVKGIGREFENFINFVMSFVEDGAKIATGFL